MMCLAQTVAWPFHSHDLSQLWQQPQSTVCGVGLLSLSIISFYSCIYHPHLLLPVKYSTLLCSMNHPTYSNPLPNRMYTCELCYHPMEPFAACKGTTTVANFARVMQWVCLPHFYQV